MNEPTTNNNCERAGELVAYFYGEASRVERESFDSHLACCGACRDELAAFGEVREAVGQWHAEILNSAGAVSSAGGVVPETRRENASIAVAPKRSARAALREFFALSPGWLRGGAVAATVVACALVALAVSNTEVRWDDGGLAFSTRLRAVESQRAPTPQHPISPPEGKAYSQAELDKLVAERDAALRELEDTRAQLDNSREANLIAAVEKLETVSATRPLSTPDAARRERRTSSAPANRSKRPRVERDEEDVPRLYDLLSEAN